MKMASLAERVTFRETLPHKNIITPDILKMYRAGNYIVELSHGRGMENEDIYGVTVVDAYDKTHRNELSQMFEVRTMARKYIEKLAKL